MPLALLEILGAGFYRLFPHPANLTPIAAMAIVGGLYLGRKYALAIPFLAMLASDIMIGLLRGVNPFHSTMWAVYLGFACYGLIGLKLRGRSSAPRLTIGLLVGACAFFLLTNTAAWLASPAFYARSFAGWMQAIAAGLPFFRNQLLGDFCFTFAFVGLIEFSRNKAAISPRWAFLARPVAE